MYLKVETPCFPPLSLFTYTMVGVAPDRSDVLLPAAAGETVPAEDSAKLLCTLLDFMGIKVEAFSFWFEVFKTHILNIFCAEIKAKNSSEPGT